MRKVKIILNRSGCIGCGSCTAIAPNFFRLGDDGKSELLGSHIESKNGRQKLETEVSQEELRSLKDASQACPVQIIEVVEL